MSPENDPLLAELGRLAPRDADDLHAERVRRRAQAILAEERRLLERPWLRAARRAFQQAIAPTAVAGTVAVYLIWAFSFVGALYR
jgi:hypothetical protein